MVSRIVLNTISYHGHGAIENIVPELKIGRASCRERV